MTAAEDAPSPALAAALEIAARGWHPFPLDHPALSRCASAHKAEGGACTGDRGKHPVGHWPTMVATRQHERMLRMWFSGEPRNIGIGCKASKLLVLDEDEEGALARLAKQLGEEVPPTYQVRTGRAKHYYFADPDGEFGNSAGALKDHHIDVRGSKGRGEHGGYVVAAGSVHHTGTVYEALNPDAPVLPIPEWIKEQIRSRPEGGGEEGSGRAPAGGWTDEPRYGYADQLRAQYQRHLDQTTTPGFRHKMFLAARDGWRLVDLGLIDHVTMLNEVKDVIVRVWGADPDERDRTIVYSEARQAASASPWVLLDSGASKLKAGGVSADDFFAEQGEQAESPAPARGRLNLPAEFWDSRPSLKHIRDAALSCWACPDAVLGAVLARQSAYCNPEDVVDLGIGQGPLSIFTIVYGPPSAGKGVAMRTAADLLPVPPYLSGSDFRERPIGSGEGITESYYGTVSETDPASNKQVKVRKQVRHNALFVMDEGETMIRLITRSGSTLATTIRRAWSGETLGEANASAERDRQVDRRTYSIGLTVAFQPAAIGPLFNDQEVGGGTPHRFLYLAADDDTLPEQPPEDLPVWPGPLTTEHGHDPELARQWQVPAARTFRLVDEAAREELRRARWAGLRRASEVSEMDGHINQMRGRVAAHLALLDGRHDITGQDWELAGQVVEVSSRVREAAIAFGRAQVAAVARREDERHIRRETAVEAARLTVNEVKHDEQLSRGAAVLARRVLKVAPVAGLPRAELRNAAGRYKRSVTECLEYAVEQGWLIVSAEGMRAGGTRYLVGPDIGSLPS